jgi:hypothetical protein
LSRISAIASSALITLLAISPASPDGLTLLKRARESVPMVSALLEKTWSTLEIGLT